MVACYEIVKANKHIILNKEGNVLIKDIDSGEVLWVPQAYIKYNAMNEPYICFRENENNEENYNNETVEVLNTEEIHEHLHNSEEIDEHLHNAEEIDEHLDNAEEIDEHLDNAEEIDEHLHNAEDEVNERSIWNYDQTLLLIAGVESRYDDLYHPQKRKHVWNDISNDLLSHNISFSAASCSRKWKNLLRTYKSSKDKITKSGRVPTRFLFYDRIDILLGDKPNNCSPHSIDVNSPQNMCADAQIKNATIEENRNASDEDTSNSSETNIKKRKRVDLSTIKRNYYKTKQEANDRNSKAFTDYLKENLDLKKKKLELEEKRLKLIEQLLNKKD